MDTTYTCEECLSRVHEGDGYIHTEDGVHWAIHHRGCADLTDSYCIAVPRHWSDLLSAHWWLSRQRSEVSASL